MASTHLKNISQIGNLPQVGAKIKNIWNHRPVIVFQFQCRHDIQTKSKLAKPLSSSDTTRVSGPSSSRGFNGSPAWKPPTKSWGFRLTWAAWKKPLCHSIVLMGLYIYTYIYIYGCFLKWWYPTTMGFPTKNDHFGVFWRYPYFRKHSYMFISGSLYWLIKISYHWVVLTNQGLEHCWLCQSYPLQNARWFAPIRLVVKTATTILPRKLTHPLKNWWLEDKPFLLE